MAALTLVQAQAQLDAWLAASMACANAQSYEIAGRQLTRANAAEIRRNVDYWGSKVEMLQIAQAAGLRRGSARTRTVLLGA